MDHKENSKDSSTKKWVPTWFKISIVILIGPIVLKLQGLQVFLEISFEGKPYIAALTKIETYYIPLGLLLAYILVKWVLDTFFNSDDV